MALDDKNEQYASHKRVTITVPGKRGKAGGRMSRPETRFGPFSRVDDEQSTPGVTKFYFYDQGSLYVAEHHKDLADPNETAVDPDCVVQNNTNIFRGSYYSTPYAPSGATGFSLAKVFYFKFFHANNRGPDSSPRPWGLIDVKNPATGLVFKQVPFSKPLTKAKAGPYGVRLTVGGEVFQLAGSNPKFVGDPTVQQRIAALETRIAGGDSSSETALALANANLELQEFGSFDFLADLGVGQSLRWMGPPEYREHWTPQASVRADVSGKWSVKAGQPYFAEFDPFDTEHYKVTNWPTHPGFSLGGLRPSSVAPSYGYDSPEVSAPKAQGGTFKVALVPSTMISHSTFSNPNYNFRERWYPCQMPTSPMFPQRMHVDIFTAVPYSTEFVNTNPPSSWNLWVGSTICKLVGAEYYPVGVACGHQATEMDQDQFTWYDYLSEVEYARPVYRTTDLLFHFDNAFHDGQPTLTQVSSPFVQEVYYYGEPKFRSVGAFSYKGLDYVVWTKQPISRGPTFVASCTFNSLGPTYSLEEYVEPPEAYFG